MTMSNKKEKITIKGILQKCKVLFAYLCYNNGGGIIWREY